MSELEAVMKVSFETRNLLKHLCRKDQTYDQFILDLLKFRSEHKDNV